MYSIKPTIGAMRHQSDLRQIAGLMLITGICAIFQPIGNVASLISPGNTSTTGVPFSALMGGLSLVSMGIISLFIGYNQLVHDWGNKTLTLFAILLTQTGFIPYLTDISDVGQQARSGAAFIPEAYNASESAVRFVGAMGILGIMAYGFSFIGAFSFLQFSLYTYQTGNHRQRSAPYFHGRMTFYAFTLFMAGLSQLMLGSFIMANYGGGVLEKGTIGVAMYVVNFPAISIFLGLIQIFNAVWGLARSYGVGIFGTNDQSFQMSMFVGWFLQLVLQVLVQVGYVPGDGLAVAAPSITALSLGLNLMPAYLDYKARTLPEEIPTTYYGTGEEKSVADSTVPHAGAEMEA
jgi:hypothetical protein|uniref:Uncharacterized protein n=1 Tax=Phaeodactylum tricornutum TaxID=2850 RepID=A0A8J9SJ44_PHATR